MPLKTLLLAALAAAVVAVVLLSGDHDGPVAPFPIATKAPSRGSGSSTVPAPTDAEGALPLGSPGAADPPSPLRTMSVQELIGQRIILAFDGYRLPGVVESKLEQGKAAGVILFERNVRSPAQVRRLTSAVQVAAQRSPVALPALVMVDQEGGLVHRLPGPPEESAARMARLPPGEIEAIGRATAESLRDFGVNVDLAPVTDIGYPGGALRGEQRTFGSTPEAVSRRAGAFMVGVQQGGIAATAKHFPGFGAATTNTDQAPATIDLSPGELRRGLTPFTHLVSAGAKFVMLSTAVYPRIAPQPAALAQPIATKLLRRNIGFRGVSISDALDTPALEAIGSPGQVAVQAAAAGTDLLIFANTTEASLGAAVAIRSAVETGAISAAELRRSARRVLAARAEITWAGG